MRDGVALLQEAPLAVLGRPELLALPLGPARGLATLLAHALDFVQLPLDVLHALWADATVRHVAAVGAAHPWGVDVLALGAYNRVRLCSQALLHAALYRLLAVKCPLGYVFHRPVPVPVASVVGNN